MPGAVAFPAGFAHLLLDHSESVSAASGAGDAVSISVAPPLDDAGAIGASEVMDSTSASATAAVMDMVSRQVSGGESCQSSPRASLRARAHGLSVMVPAGAAMVLETSDAASAESGMGDAAAGWDSSSSATGYAGGYRLVTAVESAEEPEEGEEEVGEEGEEEEALGEEEDEEEQAHTDEQEGSLPGMVSVSMSDQPQSDVNERDEMLMAEIFPGSFENRDTGLEDAAVDNRMDFNRSSQGSTQFVWSPPDNVASPRSSQPRSSQALNLSPPYPLSRESSQQQAPAPGPQLSEPSASYTTPPTTATQSSQPSRRTTNSAASPTGTACSGGSPQTSGGASQQPSH